MIKFEEIEKDHQEIKRLKNLIISHSQELLTKYQDGLDMVRSRAPFLIEESSNQVGITELADRIKLLILMLDTLAYAAEPIVFDNNFLSLVKERRDGLISIIVSIIELKSSRYQRISG